MSLDVLRGLLVDVMVTAGDFAFDSSGALVSEADQRAEAQATVDLLLPVVKRYANQRAAEALRDYARDTWCKDDADEARRAADALTAEVTA